jgi:tetratricopeptide (TPR) repeat protein
VGNWGGMYYKLEEAHKLSDVYLQLGQVDEAEQLLRQAVVEAENWYRRGVKIDPRFRSGFTARRHLIWFYAIQGGEKLDQAIAWAKEERDKTPEDPDVFDTLGWLHYLRVDFSEAETCLKKSVELFGENLGFGWPLSKLGLVYERQGKRDAAIDAYRKAIATGSFNKEAKDALERLEKEE